MREEIITMAQATLKAIRDFFNEGSSKPFSVKEFTDQLKKLSDQDKEDLKNGIGDGTLTY